jgi:hypothetical protein
MTMWFMLTQIETSLLHAPLNNYISEKVQPQLVLSVALMRRCYAQEGKMSSFPVKILTVLADIFY